MTDDQQGWTMSDITKTEARWKQTVVSEVIEYWIVVVYLASFLGAFTWYRRFVLAAHEITYLHYGTSVLEALVLAKLILIGDALHLAHRLDDKPLIVPTLYKAVVFSLWVGLFTVLEHTVVGLLHERGVAAGVQELMSTGKFELLARCLVTFCAFIPFFAFKELQRVLGVDKLLTLFFRRRGLHAPTCRADRHGTFPVSSITRPALNTEALNGCPEVIVPSLSRIFGRSWSVLMAIPAIAMTMSPRTTMSCPVIVAIRSPP